MSFLGIQRKQLPHNTTPPQGVSGTLVLTEAGAKRIKVLLQEASLEHGVFRIALKGGGCSGFGVHFATEKEPKDQDHLFEAFGVRVCMDPKSFGYLEGSVLDFVSQGGKKELKLISPKMKKSCSCGESFSL